MVVAIHYKGDYRFCQKNSNNFVDYSRIVQQKSRSIHTGCKSIPPGKFEFGGVLMNGTKTISTVGNGLAHSDREAAFGIAYRIQHGGIYAPPISAYLSRIPERLRRRNEQASSLRMRQSTSNLPWQYRSRGPGAVGFLPRVRNELAAGPPRQIPICRAGCFCSLYGWNGSFAARFWNNLQNC